jgi:hypothetical protein
MGNVLIGTCLRHQREIIVCYSPGTETAEDLLEEECMEGMIIDRPWSWDST